MVGIWPRRVGIRRRLPRQNPTAIAPRKITTTISFVTRQNRTQIPMKTLFLLMALMTALNPIEISLAANETHIATLKEKKQCPRCNLAGADLAGAKLPQAKLDGANLSNATLVGAHLRNASLARVNFSGADLRRANLRGVNLSYANLSRARLQGANLRGAILRGANLGGANVTNTNITGAQWENALTANAKGGRTQSFATPYRAPLAHHRR